MGVPRKVFRRERGMPNRRKDGFRRDGDQTFPERQARVRGAKAFAEGLPRTANPYWPGRGRWKNWDSSWIKAKLAAEQGKKRL